MLFCPLTVLLRYKRSTELNDSLEGIFQGVRFASLGPCSNGSIMLTSRSLYMLHIVARIVAVN